MIASWCLRLMFLHSHLAIYSGLLRACPFTDLKMSSSFRPWINISFKLTWCHKKGTGYQFSCGDYQFSMLNKLRLAHQDLRVFNKFLWWIRVPSKQWLWFASNDVIRHPSQSTSVLGLGRGYLRGLRATEASREPLLWEFYKKIEEFYYTCVLSLKSKLNLYLPWSMSG